MFGTIVWVAIGLGLLWFIWKVGLGMLRSMTSSLPPPPPSGEMRRINARYRCSVCGVELRLTMAPDEDPPPPRHCMEDMALIVPKD
ncbi:MAG: hypothetical protein EBU98_04700 [Actinobacteria bacterium]|nr:hypothetical protein [Actinomycetota bacterium]NDC46807.1 hypothetical protein [Actinomycetota bacterium]NDE67182.1 hypothetical protein [Actinomycetota bacterium]